MKLIVVFLMALAASAQVSVVPNDVGRSFPIINNNFSWLNTHKATASAINVTDYATGSPVDDTARIQAAINATPSGGTLSCPLGKSYRITAQLHITAPMTVQLDCTITQSTSGATGFLVTSGSVTFAGHGGLVGPQYAALKYGEMAIYAHGVSAASPISNVIVRDIAITNWGGFGIYGEYINDSKAENLRITNIHYAGLAGYSWIGGEVSGNTIDNINCTGATGDDNCYGITLTRHATPSAVTDPPSANVSVNGNRVANVPAWECLDTHSGINLKFIGNICTNAHTAISVGASTDGGEPRVEMIAPHNVIVSDNQLDSGVTDGSRSYGIAFTGVSSMADYVSYGNYTSGITAVGSAGQTCLLSGFNGGVGATATVALTDTNTITTNQPLVVTNGGSGFAEAPTSAAVASGTATCSGTATVATVIPYLTNDAATGLVSGNQVTGFGLASSAIGTCLYFRDTSGVTVSDNNLKSCANSAIMPYYNNVELHLSGGHIEGVWGNSVEHGGKNSAMAIYAAAYNNSITVAAGLTAVKGTAVHDVVLTEGIRAAIDSSVIAFSFNTDADTQATVTQDATIEGRLFIPSSSTAGQVVSTSATGAASTTPMRYDGTRGRMGLGTSADHATNGLELGFGSLGEILATFGSAYSYGAPFMASNALQPTYGVDLWHQVIAPAGTCPSSGYCPPSYLLILPHSSSSDRALSLYRAASGTADGSFATFWGSPILEIDNTGRIAASNLAGASLRSLCADGNGRIETCASFYTIVSELPACASATLLNRRAVTDANSVTPGSAAVGGGTYTTWAKCVFNSSGSVYSWFID